MATKTPEEKLAEKQALTAAIGKDYAMILAAEAGVHDLNVAAAPQIAKLVKENGPGPHKVPMPDGKTFLASFRKSGETYAIHAIDAASVT